MVAVELLKDVAEGGIEWTSDAPRDAAGRRPKIKTARVKNPNFVEGGDEPNYVDAECRAGLILTMHEASAEKWVSRGLAKII